MPRVLAAFAVLFTCLMTVATSGRAADFALRDDLAAHLDALRPMYRPSELIDLPARRGGIDRATLAPPEERDEDGLQHFVIHLSGDIIKGDRDRLETFLGTINPEDTWFTWSLVLDSNGGDFLEGIAIGMWLRASLSSQDPNFMGSYVLQDSECLSACALIFALSSHRRMLDDTDSANYVELGGRLGFHMGFLKESIAASRIPIRDAMNLTYDIMAAYMVLIEDQTSPPELIIEALKARDAQSFYYVEAGPKAYDLGFVPVSRGPLSEPLSITALSMERVEAFCMHLLEISQLPRTVVNEDYGFMQSADAETARELFAGRETDVLRGNFVSGESCLVGLSPNGNLLIDVSAQEIHCRDSKDPFANWCAIDQETTYDNLLISYATNALLADVSGCPMGRLDARIDPEGTALDPDDWPASLGAIEIRQTVTLRATPSLTGESLGELPAGSVMRLRDCAVTDDNQAIWLQVDPDGKAGWISARFARF